LLIFKDRKEAGKQLAQALEKYKNQPEAVVVGLARGGVIVAFEVAKALRLPLDVLVVRKIGAPGNEELALGAITEKGEAFYNERLVSMLHVSKDYLVQQGKKERQLAEKRSSLYRRGHPPIDLQGKTIILVDDGIATGATTRAAIKALKARKVKKMILAVPVAAPDSLHQLEKEVNEVCCLSSPSFFEAVGASYEHFDQATDEEIIRLLK
jgi:putative phosphoribosyl transferase